MKLNQARFIFRTVTERDVPSIVALWKDCFGNTPSEKYIRWRYFGTPDGVAPALLAFHDNDCAGSYMVWPMRVMLDGICIKAVAGVDAMTHPNYRGRGLFSSLAIETYELATKCGYEVFFGFANERSLPIGIRSLNWDHVCDVTRWVRPLWFFGTSSLSGIAAAASFMLSSNSTNGLRIVEGAPTFESIEALLARFEMTQGICCLFRNREWMAWRYHADSDINYRWIAGYSGSELRTLAVWRLEPRTRHAFLCELIGDSRSVSAILTRVLRDAYRSQARVVEFPTNDPVLIPILKSHRFVQRPGLHFVARSFVGRTLPANIHNVDAWRVYGGDVDYF